MDEHQQHVSRADEREPDPGHHRREAGQATQRHLRPAVRDESGHLHRRPEHAAARGVRRAAAHRALAAVHGPRRVVRPQRARHAQARGHSVRRGDGSARRRAEPGHAALLRHFNTISVCDFDDASLTRVYGAIVDWWGDRASSRPSVMGKAPTLVKATLEIYNTIKSELLPTPAKSALHVQHARPDPRCGRACHGGRRRRRTPGARPVVGARESLRVFHDRLVNDEDRLWFFDFMRKMVEQAQRVASSTRCSRTWTRTRTA